MAELSDTAKAAIEQTLVGMMQVAAEQQQANFVIGRAVTAKATELIFVTDPAEARAQRMIAGPTPSEVMQTGQEAKGLELTPPQTQYGDPVA